MKRFIVSAGSNADTLGRFIAHFASYLHAVAEEAEQRDKHLTLDAVAYNTLRRDLSGVHCCLDLMGCMIGGDLPNIVFEHPAFQQMHNAAVDMVTWSNVSLVLTFLRPEASRLIDRAFRTYIRTIWSSQWDTLRTSLQYFSVSAVYRFRKLWTSSVPAGASYSKSS